MRAEWPTIRPGTTLPSSPFGASVRVGLCVNLDRFRVGDNPGTSCPPRPACRKVPSIKSNDVCLHARRFICYADAR